MSDTTSAMGRAISRQQGTIITCNMAGCMAGLAGDVYYGMFISM